MAGKSVPEALPVEQVGFKDYHNVRSIHRGIACFTLPCVNSVKYWPGQILSFLPCISRGLFEGMSNELRHAGGTALPPGHSSTKFSWQSCFSIYPQISSQSEQLQKAGLQTERNWCNDWLAQYFCIGCSGMQNIVALRSAIEYETKPTASKFAMNPPPGGGLAPESDGMLRF